MDIIQLNWFNLDKCAVMHFGLNNIGSWVESYLRRIQVGVIVQSNLKVDMQCNKAACEANRRLGMIKRNFRFKSRSVMLPYKSIVRPHSDYCVQAWETSL